MSKRFTSLLVGALAGMLLVAPAQAQQVQKAMKPKQLKSLSVLNKKPATQKQVEAAKAQAAVEEVAKESAKTPVWGLPGTLGVRGTRTVQAEARQNVGAPLLAPRRAGETVDENGIITAPAEGQASYYERNGIAIVSGYEYYQNGHVTIVETDGGVVYVKNILSRYLPGSWVKGTKTGNTISIPVGQPLSYNYNYSTTLSLYWGEYTSNFVKDTTKDVINFTIDGDKIILQDTDEDHFLGVFWDDDNSFASYGDYETVWTVSDDYTPAATDLVQLPAGAETLQWHARSLAGKANVNVAFVGDELYVQGLFANFPEAWYKGTIDGTTVTFEGRQYLGVYGTYDVFALGSEDGSTISDYVMEYNAEDKTLTAVTPYLFANASDDIIYYLAYYENLVIREETFDIVHGVPYWNNFDTQDETDEFYVEDLNNDGTTWTFNNGAAQYSYSSNFDGDDWLISPGVMLQAGKSYQFSIDAYSQSEYYPERFEVLIGTQPTAAAMVAVLIDPTDVTWGPQPETFAKTFSPSADGVYYFGIHAISDRDQYYLYVDNFAVESPLTAESAAAPRLAVQPDPFGANKAVVTVTAPSRTLSGGALDIIPLLNIYRDGKVVKSYFDVEPAAINSFVDEAPNGAHVYQAITFDEDGNNGQKTEKLELFVGLDVPAAVEELHAVADDDELTVVAEPVSTGLNEGVINAEDVVYSLWTAHLELYFIWYIPVKDDLIDISDNPYLSAEVEGASEGEQRYELFCVQTHNDAGDGGEYYFYACLGEPYELPLEENFAGQSMKYQWMTDYSDGAYMDFSDEASDEDGGAVVATSEAGDDYALLELGKLAVADGNPTLVFDAKGTSKQNVIRVIAEKQDGTKVNVGAALPAADFKTYKISLAELVDEPWVKLTIYFDLKAAGEIVIDNIKILDLLDYNLTASVSAPKRVNAGENAQVDVTVRNMGDLAASDYTVKLYAGETELLNVTENGSLASFGKKVYSAELTTTRFDEAGDITLRAEVEYDNDLDLDDNDAETVIALKQSSASKPENVKGEAVDGGVKLTWNAPSSTASEQTEDFEDSSVFVPFSIGGIDADNHYGSFGDWTLYDGNGIGVYGFSGLEFENCYLPQAWQVVYTDASSDLAAYTAHSGNQFLWSFSPADEDEDGNAMYPAADHWLISPALPGVAQTISFVARAITAEYGQESFEVLYSETDNKVGSFKKVEGFTTDAVDWTEFSAALPAGAKYFAIRYTSQDIFGLLLDDVTFTAEGGNISGYNVWVNGELAETTTSTTITLEGVTTNDWFAVSAVYDNGQESQPVVFIFGGANQEITAIQQITGSNEPVDIYTLDGKLVRSQATSLKGLKGAYIINNVKVVVK